MFCKRIFSLVFSIVMLAGLVLPCVPAMTASASEVNLALDATVTATNAENGCPAENTIDGLVNTFWDGGVCPAEIIVDLGDFYKLSKINVVTYYEDSRYYTYTVSTSDNGVNYTEVAKKDDSRTGSSAGTDHEVDVTARYVSISVLSNSANPSAHVNEISIYGTPDSAHIPSEVDIGESADGNIAYGKPTRSNSNDGLSKRVADGNETTYWTGEDCPRYVDVDLLDNYDISEIKVFTPGSKAFSFVVYGSLDGVDYTRIAKQELAVCPEGGFAFEFENALSYRIIRVNVLSNNNESSRGAMLSEIKVFGTKNSSPVTKTREKLEFTTYSEWLKAREGFDVSTIADDNGNYDISKTFTPDDTISAVRALVGRVLGDQYNDWFVFEIVNKAGNDFYELSQSADGKICIKGNKGVSLTTGLNYYLKYYCNVSVSQQTKQVKMPKSAPKLDEVISNTSPFEVRYAYNYCTLSYTMAFYGYDEWQRELDYLALSGVNLILDTTATEALWVSYLQKLGYTADTAKDFVCGYAYKAWWLMGNLEGYGGTVSDQWIYDTLEMARVNERFMTVLGIQPCLQAYVGMFPNNFASVASTTLGEMGYDNNVSAFLTEQGSWGGGFHRPIVMNNTYDGYEKLSDMFYETQNDLYGRVTDYYCGDICHEGGVIPQGASKEELSARILKLMMKADPDAVWIIQAWWANPTKETLKGFGDDREEHVLILDLAAAHGPKYPDSVTYGGKEFMGTSWVFSILDNYGGRTGMHGSLKQLARTVYMALNSAVHMKGIGITPEGTEQNPVVYELFWELGWSSEKIDVAKWLDKYVVRRYGEYSENTDKAWTTMLSSVYGVETIDGTSTNTVMNNYPAFGTSGGYFETGYRSLKTESALKSLMADFEKFKDNENFIYDIVDLMRQHLSNVNYQYYVKMSTANDNKDYDSFVLYAAKFIDTMELIDEISSYQRDNLLGTWIGKVDNWVNDLRTGDYDDYSVDLMKINAKALITSWASKPLANYAYRQYAGLGEDYYIPMWQIFIDSVSNNLANGRKATTFPATKRYFELAWNVVIGDKIYDAEVSAADGDKYSRGLTAIFEDILQNHCNSTITTALVGITVDSASGFEAFAGKLSNIPEGSTVAEVIAKITKPEGTTVVFTDANGAAMKDTDIVIAGCTVRLRNSEGEDIASAIISDMVYSEATNTAVEAKAAEMKAFIETMEANLSNNTYTDDAKSVIVNALKSVRTFIFSPRQRTEADFTAVEGVVAEAVSAEANGKQSDDGDDENEDPGDDDEKETGSLPYIVLAGGALIVVVIVILEVEKNRKKRAEDGEKRTQDADATMENPDDSNTEK